MLVMIFTKIVSYKYISNFIKLFLLLAIELNYSSNNKYYI